MIEHMLGDINVLSSVKFTKGNDWVKAEIMDGQHNT